MPVSPPTRPGRTYNVPSEQEFLVQYQAYLSRIVFRNSRQFVSYLPLLGMDPDDLEQEALIRALKARETYDPSRGVLLKSWVVRQVHHYLTDQDRRCRSMWRLKQRRERSTPLYEYQRNQGGQQAEWELLSDLTTNVSPTAKRVLEMRLSGDTLQVIAKNLSITISYVRNALEEIREQARYVFGAHITNETVT